MNEFISNILSRHLDPVTNIIPRLPGKFEPVNLPASNNTDLSTGIETVREVSLSQPINKISNDHSIETNFNTVTPLTQQPNTIPDNRVVQHTQTIFPENKNADAAPGSKNIIPVEPGFSNDKKVNPENSFEFLNKQEIPVHSEIQPITIKPLTEKPVNDPEQQEMTNSFLINKLNDDTDVPANKEGTLHQHISILKQKIVKASAEKKNNISEEKKTIQPGLIKPVMNNLNGRTNLNASSVSNEQPMSSVIKVSIGRIEVRAVTTAAPAKVNRTVLQKPNLTLEDYLKRRNGTGK